MNRLDLKDEAGIASDTDFAPCGEVVGDGGDSTPAIAVDSDAATTITYLDGFAHEGLAADEGIHTRLGVAGSEPACHQGLQKPQGKEATDAEEDRLDEPASAEDRWDNSQKGTHTEAGQDEAWRDDLKGEEYECGDEPQLPYWKEGDEFGHNRFGP